MLDCGMYPGIQPTCVPAILAAPKRPRSGSAPWARVALRGCSAGCLPLGEHIIACPSALIGASNLFELAVAAASSLFGLQSGAALATVVGALIQVPLMLPVVKIVNRSKGRYDPGLVTR